MTNEKHGKSHRKDATSKGSSAPSGQAEPNAADGERIAKRLARAGIASRRDAEVLIAEGRVQVNGKVLSSPAFNVCPSDRIEVNGKPLPPIERTRVFLFHKPAGVVTTSRDPEGRRTVFDVLPAGLPRLVTIGRLDINTEGLLVLTNDGGLARTLELPATGWMRRYRVRVHGRVDPKALEDLKNGIAVDGVFYGAIEATLDREQGSNAWLGLGLREGKNREVKNVLGALGLDVTRLIRVSYGPFQLGALAEGEVQEIKGRTLREQLGERLVAEAGANFDAPIAKPFSNKPVRAERTRPADAASEGARKPRERREGGGEGFVKNRKREREDKREEMRGRLQTRPKGRREEGEGRDGNVRHNRASHVWMAPGARPQGKRKAETTEEKRARPSDAGPSDKGKRSSSGKDRSRPAGEAGADKRFSKGGKPNPARAHDNDKPRAEGDKYKPRADGDRPRSSRPFAKGKPSGSKFSGKPGRPSQPGKGRPSGSRPGKPGRGR